MTRLHVLCDTERCIGCGSCAVACRVGNDLPFGVNRRRVITIDSGKPSEISVSVSCMHCDDAPCVAVCPVVAIRQRENGLVLVDKKSCIGCGYCFMACPFGVPQFSQGEVAGARGVMDKCTFCADGPTETCSGGGKQLNGRNRSAEGMVPRCSGICTTRALLAGDADVVTAIYRERLFCRGTGGKALGRHKTDGK